jgi:hypothetical protein
MLRLVLLSINYTYTLDHEIYEKKLKRNLGLVQITVGVMGKVLAGVPKV